MSFIFEDKKLFNELIAEGERQLAKLGQKTEKADVAKPNLDKLEELINAPDREVISEILGSLLNRLDVQFSNFSPSVSMGFRAADPFGKPGDPEAIFAPPAGAVLQPKVENLVSLKDFIDFLSSNYITFKNLPIALPKIYKKATPSYLMFKTAPTAPSLEEIARIITSQIVKQNPFEKTTPAPATPATPATSGPPVKEFPEDEKPRRTWGADPDAPNAAPLGATPFSLPIIKNHEKEYIDYSPSNTKVNISLLKLYLEKFRESAIHDGNKRFIFWVSRLIDEANKQFSLNIEKYKETVADKDYWFDIIKFGADIDKPQEGGGDWKDLKSGIPIKNSNFVSAESIKKLINDCRLVQAGKSLKVTDINTPICDFLNFLWQRSALIIMDNAVRTKYQEALKSAARITNCPDPSKAVPSQGQGNAQGKNYPLNATKIPGQEEMEASIFDKIGDYPFTENTLDRQKIRMFFDQILFAMSKPYFDIWLAANYRLDGTTGSDPKTEIARLRTAITAQVQAGQKACKTLEDLVEPVVITKDYLSLTGGNRSGAAGGPVMHLLDNFRRIMKGDKISAQYMAMASRLLADCVTKVINLMPYLTGGDNKGYLKEITLFGNEWTNELAKVWRDADPIARQEAAGQK